MNQIAFDALLGRIDAEISVSPLPPLAIPEADPCPPRPPEPPPATPSRSWLARLLSRRSR